MFKYRPKGSHATSHTETWGEKVLRESSKHQGPGAGSICLVGGTEHGQCGWVRRKEEDIGGRSDRKPKAFIFLNSFIET